MRKLLTDKAIGYHAKRPPETGRLEIFDTARTGLCFRVTANGAVSWSHVYRHGGDLRRDTLGAYPLITLAKARALVRDAQEAIGRGDDPRTIKAAVAAVQEQQQADTVEAVAAKFIARYASKRRWRDLTRAIERDVVPVWRDRPMTSITRKEIIALVDDIADRGAPVQANRTVTILKSFFGWAIDKDIITTDPTSRVKKPTKEVKRTRKLKTPEIVALWSACTAIGEPFGELFRLLLLTGQRKGEIAHLEWSEIDFDKRRIVIPASKYKTEVEHLVPLSDAALTILKARPRIAGCKYVFSTNGKTPVSAFSKAKVRLDAAMLAALRCGGAGPEAGTLAPWTIHDMRRTCRTGLSELGIDGDIGERVLGHAVGGIRATYDIYQYEPEMRNALDRWAAHLAGIVSPQPSNVVALRAQS